MSGGGGGDPFAVEEEHENHERYLLTYADMITLLMALFIILFAIGQTDKDKFEAFRGGLHDALGNPLLPGAGGILAGTPNEPPEIGLNDQAAYTGAGNHGQGTGDGLASGTGTGTAEGYGTHVSPQEADNLADTLEGLLAGQGLADATSVRVEADGVVVSLNTDGLIFASASWDLLPEGLALIDQLVAPLGQIDNPVTVRGHTDDQPMGNGFSNFDLSALRATTVAERLMSDGIAPIRVTAGGVGDTRPIATNATAEGRALNRRVELLVVVKAEDAVPDIVAVGDPIIDPFTAASPVDPTPVVGETFTERVVGLFERAIEAARDAAEEVAAAEAPVSEADASVPEDPAPEAEEAGQ